MVLTVASDSGRKTIRFFCEGIDCSDAESLTYLREVVRAGWYKLYECIDMYCIVLLLLLNQGICYCLLFTLAFNSKLTFPIDVYLDTYLDGIIVCSV